MNTGVKMSGDHVLIARGGDAYTIPGAGNVSRSSKPDAADPVWVDIGVIEGDFDIEKKKTDIEIFAPAPGRLRLYDMLSTKSSHIIKVKTKEFSPVAFEILFGTLSLNAVLAASSTANTQYNPLAGKDFYGWVKVQQYDQNDALWNTFDVWCRICVEGAVKMGGDGIIEAPFTFYVLHSTLNTGLLA